MLHEMQLNTVQLMPIGRFSRLTGVGVKALRHYDEVGLLVPAAVDDETGYRFYSADQVDRAEAIRLLRRLDMPLDEIASTLAAGDRLRCATRPSRTSGRWPVAMPSFVRPWPGCSGSSTEGRRSWECARSHSRPRSTGGSASTSTTAPGR
jgi:hypothetical protein